MKDERHNRIHDLFGDYCSRCGTVFYKGNLPFFAESRGNKNCNIRRIEKKSMGFREFAPFRRFMAFLEKPISTKVGEKLI